MGVEYQNTAIYTCDQTGEQVVRESDLPVPPDGWVSIGSLWFKDWAAVRDYAAAQVGTGA